MTLHTFLCHPVNIEVEEYRIPVIAPPPFQETTRATEPLWHAVDLCERGAALLLLAAAAPVLAASSLAIWAFSRECPLIAHRRVGWRGETLWMLKLRTMWNPDAPARQHGIEYVSEEAWERGKSADDPRVCHWFARFCRRHSIDELPQLWHVVRGEMALIGPRPMTPSEIRRHYGDDAGELLETKPGIAGLWQTSGRNRLTYAERRDLDLQFVRNRSLGMYARILLRTIPEIWRGSNSW
jgi:exopolysaccharide production protein ExoY